MLEHVLVGLLMGIPSAYIVHVMILKPKISHEGPFPIKRRVIFLFDEGLEHSQKAALFDVIRRIFGAYHVTENGWIVKTNALGEVWSCPTCLSFWAALLFSIPLAFWFPEPILAVPVHFGIAAISTAFHYKFLGIGDVD